MKGFKHTGRGPKYGSFSFGSKAGFTGSTGKVQEVRGYTRGVPKAKKAFAEGGVVTGDCALQRRTQPVTGFDQEAGGKSPLRPGYAEGGKVNNVGSAIKMVKTLIARGMDPTKAAQAAANRHGVRASEVATPSQASTADVAALARGGKVPVPPTKDQKQKAKTIMHGQFSGPSINHSRTAKKPQQKLAMGGPARPMGQPMGRPMGPIKPAAPLVSGPSPLAPGRYGNFGRAPLIRSR